MNLLHWYLLLLLLAFVNTIFAAIKLRAFLARNSSISSVESLADFKRMVRWQMHAALVQIGFLGASGLIGLYGIFTEQLSLLLVLCLNGVVIGISYAMKATEKRAKSLPVNDQSLFNEYRAICESWVKKPLPDF